MNQESLEKFYAALGKVVDAQWRVGAGVFIRRRVGKYDQCPLSALIGMDANSFIAGGEFIGLSHDESRVIASIADGSKCRPDAKAIRARMLEILRLTDQPSPIEAEGVAAK